MIANIYTQEEKTQHNLYLANIYKDTIYINSNSHPLSHDHIHHLHSDSMIRH